MPNWIQNRLTVTGRFSDIRNIRMLMKSKKSVFDFNKIVRMPDAMKRIGKASMDTDINIDASFLAYCLKKNKELPKYGFKGMGSESPVLPFDIFARYFAESKSEKPMEEQMKDILAHPDTLKEHEIDLSIGRDCAKMMDAFKTYNPIEWGYTFWGTKWEAWGANVWLINDGVQYTFLTANRNCIPIIEALAREFPGARFCYEWADEDLGQNVGSLTIRDYKKKDYTMNICTPASYRAFEMAADLWENPDVLDVLVDCEDGTYTVDFDKLNA